MSKKSIAEAHLMTFTENFQAGKLSSFEAAKELHQLHEESRYTLAELAKALNRSTAWVSFRITAIKRADVTLLEDWQHGRIKDSKVFDLVRKTRVPAEVTVNFTDEKATTRRQKRREVNTLLMVLEDFPREDHYTQGFYEALRFVAGKITLNEVAGPFARLAKHFVTPPATADNSTLPI